MINPSSRTILVKNVKSPHNAESYDFVHQVFRTSCRFMLLVLSSRRLFQLHKETVEGLDGMTILLV